MLSILGRGRAYHCTSGDFYKAVVQATLLFGSYTWVVSPWIGITLDGSHHGLARRLDKMQTRRYVTFRWIYSTMD